MTIEALRARRARLIEQKQKEQTLLEQGQGDNMALFMVNEELLEVNAQIRSLSGTQRRIGRRNTSADAAKLSVDRALYRAWAQSQDEEEETCSRREMLQQILDGCEDLLTEKQLLYLSMWSTGDTMEAIGARYGVGKPTVSRVIQSAKRRLQAAAEAQEAAQRLDVRQIDMSDSGAARRILAALTAKQAVYLYLYYGEWLSLRQIADLVGIRSHQSVMVSIHAGLRNLGRVFGCNALTLRNMGALDELAWSIYQTIDPEQLLPETEREHVHRMLPQKQQYRYTRKELLPQITIARDDLAPDMVQAVWLHARPHHGEHCPGRLLTALLERQRAMRADGRSLHGWLKSIFARLTKNLGGRVRRRENNRKKERRLHVEIQH